MFSLSFRHLVTSAALATIATVGMPFLAQADTVNMTATNPEIRTIAITGTPSFNFPSADFGGITSQNIGTVTVKSNSADGYKVSIASAN
ncbi:MAG: hypothetical protein H7Y22_11385, partial [Gemmatimonadaceae bacterium]|nr:hypothetical protein [Gloeobacterales cyanobacterium ES-bin-141]